MKVGGYRFELVKRFESSFGAAFVGRGGALLFARETEEGGYELELVRLGDFKSVRRAPVEGLTAVARVGEDAALVTLRPSRSSGAGVRERVLEVRGLKDFRVITSIKEDKPGYVAAHPEGTQIAVAHDFGPLHVWDTATGRLLWQYDSKGTGGVAYSRDGALLAVKEFAGALKIFDAAERGAKPLRSVAVGREAQIAFHPERHVVAAAGRSAVKLVDADAGKVVASIKVTKKESQGAIGHMAFSPDGRLLVTATLSDRAVGLWDVEEAEFVGHLLEAKEPLSGVEFEARGEYLLVSTYEAAEIYSFGPA